MKIALVTTELGPGGAERIVLDLAKALKRSGRLPSVVSLAPEPSNRTIPDALAKAGIEVFYVGATKRSPWKLAKLAGILRRIDPDVVHSHLMHSNLLTRLLKPLLRKPLVNSVHIADRRRFMRPWFLLDRATFALCDACTAVSKAAASFHEKALGLPPGSIKTVCNGLDKVVPAPKEELERLREAWGLKGCRRIVGSIGRLAPQKGYDLLLGMLNEISTRIPKDETWGVVVVGEGPERKALESLAKRAPQNIEVSLPGFRADAASLMALFDVFVMPSRYEGYGLALVEAMSLGLPCVANDVDSLPELCARYSNGECVDFPSEKAAAAIVSGALKKRVEPCEIMSVERMAQEYLSVYASAAGKEL